MKKVYFCGLVIVACLVSTLSSGADDLAWLDQYNVVWTTPSKNSSESMPCGGGDIGLNVWVEEGDVLFYMQRSGTFDENNEFPKLGRVRVRLSPNPFKGVAFRQELKLREGCVEISGKTPGGAAAQLRLWVEVFRPVVHLDVECEELVTVEARYESWRTEDMVLPDDGKNSRFGCFGYDAYPGEVIRRKDTVRREGDGVLWYHRNQNGNLIFDLAVKQQGLESVKGKMWNPLKNRTFGGMLVGDGMKAAGEGKGKYALTPFRFWKIKSDKPAKSHSLQAILHVDQTETLREWEKSLKREVSAQSPPANERREKTRLWWEAFWRRSHLVINDDASNPDDKAWQLGRNYQLFRYQLGCNAYGDYPTKFNGGLFTFDPNYVLDRRKHSPDWRAWGGGSFTAQNQRLVYWPMLKTGDFEFMKPQFVFYRKALGNATLRVKTYWNIEGCCFTEQMSQFGLPIACAWGWSMPEAKNRKRPADFDHGVQSNQSCKYHWESQLEFSYMILESYRFSGGDITPYLPFVKRSVRFFDEYYRMRQKERTGKEYDENGKLFFSPSTSCESYKLADNPSDVISGLRACLQSLIALPEKYASTSEKKYYSEFLGHIPDYGIEMVDGQKTVKPAWRWDRYQNVECPQFYPLFPFNQFNLWHSEADQTMFRNTWKYGKFPKNMVISWHQDGIFFARMGMTKEAAEYNTKKMQDSGRRFPTFWGPGHDWVPDHNWGGSGMLGLQEMLLQTIGDEIRILPAWPKDWDCAFKLYAPQGTVVEVKVQNGKLVNLKVSPESRRKDVVIGDGWAR